MINQSRSEDRRDRSGPRKLGQKADSLIVRDRKPSKPARHEVADLESCERDIQQSFEKLATAFAIIKDKRLYLETGCTSFEQYCEERWQITPRRGYQFASAGKVLKSLPAKVRTIVHSEAVAREVAAVPKEHRVGVLKSLAKDGPVTAKAVREHSITRAVDRVSDDIVAHDPVVVEVVARSATRHCATCTCKGGSAI